MKPVERQEIVDYVTYEDQREEFRDRVWQQKRYGECISAST
jgi:hypothetical protein